MLLGFNPDLESFAKIQFDISEGKKIQFNIAEIKVLGACKTSQVGN